MKRRFTLLGLFGLVVALAATAGAVGASKQTTSGKISMLASYSGADEQSFQAVLAGFTKQNPGATVNFISAPGSEARLAEAVKLGVGVPDVAVLTLPADRNVMRYLVDKAALKPIWFVAPVLDASYAFAWKRIGSINGTLYGLPFKATDRSAFCYDPRLFKSAGVQAPKTWRNFQSVAGRLLQAGIKPFAIPAADGQALTDIFESIYLGQQGQRRYERLTRHELEWSDSSVKDALRTMRGVIVNPLLIPGGVKSALKADFPTAVKQVFGTPPKAAMVFGGSAVLAAARSAKGVRPMSQFGAFAFPTIGKPPARVIGRADVVVMLRDSPAARALVQYLATPAAATIWARRGGFLSPNRKVDLKSYPLEASRALASALTQASAFRLDLSEQQPASFGVKLGQLLQEFVRNPSRLNPITEQLDAAAGVFQR